MTDRIFFDTNILVYLYDADSPAKQARAQELLETYPGAFVSTQVLQEFYVTVTRKFKRPLSRDEALRATKSLSRFPVIQIDVPIILSAIQLGTELQISFWDALILQAAEEAGCSTVFTEDLQHGQRIKGLRIENPFRDQTGH